MTKNLSLKVFSLCSAILIELYFFSPENLVTEEINSVVEVRQVPGNVLIVSPKKPVGGYSASVTVRGPTHLVEQFKSSQPRFRVDIPRPWKEQYSVQLNLRDINIPTGLEVVDVNPGVFDFRLERLVKKELVVVVNTNGEVPTGYNLDQISPNPSTVFVSGPMSELEGRSTISTRSLDLGEIVKSEKVELSLEEIGKNSESLVNVVSVELSVSAIPGERTFGNIPIDVLASPGVAATVEPSRAVVVFGGPKVVLENLDLSKIRVFADARGRGPGRHRIKLSGELPEGVQILASEPGDVGVLVIEDDNKQDE